MTASGGRRSGWRMWLGALAAAVAVLVAQARPAMAQIGSDRYSSIVIDARSGALLEAAGADEPRHPASLAKLMTLYMAFEALRDRRIALTDLVPVSPHAASMEPTKLGLEPGTRITVEEAILGMVTLSANDAAAALGEFLGGDETRFAQMMTLRARALGMSRTTFTNASGLPDPDEWTTARDMAVLARHLVNDFPNEYGYFSTPSFVFHRRVIFSHDSMLKRYPGADGMKTGYTIASGHNLVTSALRDNVRLIGVIFGAATNGERDIHMTALLDQGFTQENVTVGPVVAARLPSLVGTAHAATLVRPAAAPAARSRPAELWTIQVGTYASERAAQSAAGMARGLAGGGAPRVEAMRLKGRMLWRAQVAGLTPVQAQSSCAALTRRRTACFVVRPEPGQLASR